MVFTDSQQLLRSYDTSLKEKTKSLTKEKKKLETELHKTRKSLSSMQKKDTTWHTQTDSLRKKILTVSKKSIEVTSELYQSNVMKESLEQDLKITKEANTRFERQLSALGEESKITQLELNSTQTDLSLSRSYFDQLETECYRLKEEEMVELSGSRVSLEQDLIESNLQTSDSTSKSQAYQQELIELRVKCERLGSIQKKLETNNQTLLDEKIRETEKLQELLREANDRANQNAQETMDTCRRMQELQSSSVATNKTLNQNINLLQMGSNTTCTQDLQLQLQNAQKSLQHKEELNKILLEMLSQIAAESQPVQAPTSYFPAPIQPLAVVPPVSIPSNALALPARVNQASAVQGTNQVSFDFADTLIDQIQQSQPLNPNFQQPYYSSDPSPLSTSQSGSAGMVNPPNMMVEQVHTRRLTINQNTNGLLSS